MNNKNKIFTLVGIIVILITVIGLTYAFFAPQASGTTSTNATVTSNTTDLLTFSINQDISFTVSQADFASGAGNQYGEATATATLTPNNKTGSATMNYYMYLNLQTNPTVYSSTNTNQDPELMLQVFDGNNQLVTLTGLGTQKTIKGVTGYDITGVTGFKTLLSNHAISASNNTATVENWRVVITLINLDVDQNDNTGKVIRGTIVTSKDEMSACDLNPESCLTLNVSNPSSLPGKSVSLTSSGINGVWNSKYNQLEISSLGTQNEGTIINEVPQEKTPLNTYIIGLSGTTQGDGKLVHELVSIPQFIDTSVVTTYGTTPVYFMNNGFYNEQIEVDSYWTYDSTNGVFTSDPSKMTTNYKYYHAYAPVLEAGSYQICYTINNSYNPSNKLIIVVNNTKMAEIYSSTSGQIGETCFSLGNLSSTDYINISEYASSSTSSPVMTFRIEKDNQTSSLDTGFRYEGPNPNNYIMFNNELWRIIGVFKENNDAYYVKIIRNEPIGYLVWDKDNTSNWPYSSLYSLLNYSYYNWNSYYSYASQFCYGYQNTIISKCDYSIIGIQNEYRDMLMNLAWYLGGGSVTGTVNYFPDVVYRFERDGVPLVSGRSTMVNAKIGLMYASDYLFGALASDCSRITTKELYDNPNCSGKNWLYYGNEWTLNANSSKYAYNITRTGTISGSSPTQETGGVRPAGYLSTSVYKTAGTGSITDPYIIGM